MTSCFSCKAEIELSASFCTQCGTWTGSPNGGFPKRKIDFFHRASDCTNPLQAAEQIAIAVLIVAAVIARFAWPATSASLFAASVGVVWVVSGHFTVLNPFWNGSHFEGWPIRALGVLLVAHGALDLMPTNAA